MYYVSLSVSAGCRPLTNLLLITHCSSHHAHCIHYALTTLTTLTTRTTLTALITLDEEEIERWAAEHGMDHESFDELARDPRVRERVEAAITRRRITGAARPTERRILGESALSLVTANFRSKL